MATNYGSDSYCITDQLLVDTQVTNPVQLIGQRIVRRLTTPRGALANINGNPDFGWDVRQLVNAKLTPQAIVQAQAAIQAECVKDEEVLSATATLTFAGSKLTIKLSLTTSAGPFSLVLGVSQLTVDAVFAS